MVDCSLLSLLIEPISLLFKEILMSQTKQCQSIRCVILWKKGGSVLQGTSESEDAAGFIIPGEEERLAVEEKETNLDVRRLGGRGKMRPSRLHDAIQSAFFVASPPRGDKKNPVLDVFTLIIANEGVGLSGQAAVGAVREMQAVATRHLHGASHRPRRLGLRL